jgi:hypothetical protein
MPYDDKAIITDKDRKPVPQYFNTETNQYEVITGRDGANSFIEKGRVVVDSWSGTSSINKVLSAPCYGFALVNDGTGDLTISISGLNFTVKPGESYDGLFKSFLTVNIEGTSAYRAEVRE